MSPTLLIALGSVLGCIAGRVLLRLVLLLPEDKSLFKSTLQCTHCETPLSSYTHLPVLGWILSSRYCHSCKKPQPLQWFFIESITLIGTISIFWFRGFEAKLFSDLLLFYAILATSFIDWNTMLIDTRIIVTTIVLRFTWIVYYEPTYILTHLTTMLVGAGALYFIALFYETLRNRQGLGEGDAAVLGMVGLWLHWESLSFSLFIAAMSGLIVGGGVLLMNRQSLKEVPVPFAPFLCIGGGTMYIAEQARWVIF